MKTKTKAPSKHSGVRNLCAANTNNTGPGTMLHDNNNVHFLHVNGVKKPVPYYSLNYI